MKQQKLTDWLPVTDPPVRTGHYDFRLAEWNEVHRFHYDTATGRWTKAGGWIIHPQPGDAWRGLARRAKAVCDE